MIAVAALVVSIVSALIAAGSVWYARQQVKAARDAANHAETSADAATRSADLAEAVELGRRFGWRVEPISDGVYALRNVGTVNALNVSLSSANAHPMLGFVTETADKRTVAAIASGQSRLLMLQASRSGGGEVHITWTPELPDGRPITWTCHLPR